MKLYDRIFKPRTYQLSNGKQIQEKFTRTPLILLVIVLLTALSVNVTGFNFPSCSGTAKSSSIFSVICFRRSLATCQRFGGLCLIP